MKRIAIICTIIGMIMLNTITVFAYSYEEDLAPTYIAPGCWYEDAGNLVLGDFVMSDLPDFAKEFLKEWVSSKVNVIYHEILYKKPIQTAGYVFVIMDDNVKDLLSKGVSCYPYQPGYFPLFIFSGGLDGRILTIRTDGHTTEAIGKVNHVGFGSLQNVIGGSLFATYETLFPKSMPECLYEYAGDLILRDDGSIFGDYVVPRSAEDLIKKHRLTVQYQYEDGRTAAPTHTEQIAEGTSYNVPSPELAGFVASQTAVTGTMGDQDISVTVTYTAKKHALSIKYQYEDGRVAAPVHTEQVAEGASYNVASPELAGYTASQTVVTGKMGTQDVAVTVTYTPIRYTLTIRYVYDDGTSVSSDHVETLVEGTSYRVTSPLISGYTADQTMVSGAMPGHDLTVTVTYREDVPELYQLCVQFLRTDGIAVASEYTEQLEAGAAYRVESPPIAGYTPDRSVVTGTMPASDLTERVTYAKDAEPPPIDPPDPPDPPEPPPTPPSGGSADGKVLEYSMFAPMFEYLRDNGGVVVTSYIKILLLMMGICGAIALVRKVILSAVSGRDEPPEIR